SLNYGGVVDPWAAEGYQGTSPGNGNFVAAPLGGRGGFPGRPGGQLPGEIIRSAGRFPGGADTDNNRIDFLLQSDTFLSVASEIGTNNIKVPSVADLAVGQKVFIDSGTNRETAIIATIGTPGGTRVATNMDVGVTSIPV